jgi:hypothetical protein
MAITAKDQLNGCQKNIKISESFYDLKDSMRRQRIVRLKHPPSITITLSENELDELIECVANVADRAESAAYNMTGTPKAKALARERARRRRTASMWHSSPPQTS